eukprot:PITA_32937
MGFKLCFALLFLCTLLFGLAIADDGKVHIVYMGSLLNNDKEELVTSHLQVLSSVLESPRHAEQSLVRSYTYAFNGFAAVLSKEQATALVGKAGVLSVFPDPVLNLHTTHSWDYLEKDLAMAGSSYKQPKSSGADVIIGFLDTGIWPEAASFSDKGMGPVPSRWKGKCVDGGGDFNASNCNRKIIGARYYEGGEGLDLVKTIKPKFVFPPIPTPRDYSGHGTFTASTAAGSFVDNANYNGLAKGTARGGPASSSTRIATYRVCGVPYGCPGVQILAGFDDAVKDGVDIVSISIGSDSSNQFDFVNDPIAIGAFHATHKGILVVSSAGNDGPDSQTVVNSAPWIFTVGATSIDRDFQSNVVLGNGKIIQGKGITYSNLSQSAVHPLVYGGSIPAESCDGRPFDPVAASHCVLGCLDENKMKGKIVVCIPNDTAISTGTMASNFQFFTGAVGMIVVHDLQPSEAYDYGTFAGTTISKSSATEIFSYINSTRNPVATITPTEVVTNYKPAPVVASFSSRGPGALTQNILKPDISAPGLNIIAASDPPDTGFIDGKLPETMSTSFYMMSGTSVAVPHVSGAAAFLKSMNPTWSPSVIRSALMTTAIVRNNMGKFLTNAGTPFDFGAGVVNPIGALQPGLVYETSTDDYFHFLCNYGLDTENIKLIAANKTYRCPSGAKVDLISNMNYPSIAISKLNIVNGSTIVSRSVTNISPDLAPTYKVTIGAPPGLSVKVSPQILQFSQTSKKLSFDVVFKATKVATKGYVFGTLVWSDGKHNVRTPFAVNLV